MEVRYSPFLKSTCLPPLSPPSCSLRALCHATPLAPLAAHPARSARPPLAAIAPPAALAPPATLAHRLLRSPAARCVRPRACSLPSPHAHSASPAACGARPLPVAFTRRSPSALARTLAHPPPPRSARPCSFGEVHLCSPLVSSLPQVPKEPPCVPRFESWPAGAVRRLAPSHCIIHKSRRNAGTPPAYPL